MSGAVEMMRRRVLGRAWAGRDVALSPSEAGDVARALCELEHMAEARLAALVAMRDGVAAGQRRARARGFVLGVIAGALGVFAVILGLAGWLG